MCVLASTSLSDSCFSSRACFSKPATSSIISLLFLSVSCRRASRSPQGWRSGGAVRVRRHLSRNALVQVRLDKRIDLTVEYSIGIADLHAGTVIFYHAVRVEDIGTDLAAPGDIFFVLMQVLH